MRKPDSRIDGYIDFVLEEIVRLDCDGVIGWYFWRRAFVDYVMRRRFLAWQAIQICLQWLAQLETGGQS